MNSVQNIIIQNELDSALVIIKLLASIFYNYKKEPYLNYYIGPIPNLVTS